MLIINCPYCGERDESEFHYGGEAGITRPGHPDKLSDKEWGNYLFMRKNTKGLFSELWFHSAGCRKWFIVDRDTVTNEIVSIKEISKKI
ncbi:MAG: sarcosine oxidase subunit delta [Rhodospirillaceae bacterium]|nr:sarcosine oxidase subunit delta [Rhodospirillaceae bacterium]|tara:strand:+ start:274 stop:540 length:267 start_codon:yes stop_codon:yes gene_type:complete